jgi:hypothetical protein
MSPPEAGQGTRKLEDRYDGYDILGPDDDRIGKAGGLFVNEHDGREYVEVQGGLVERALGTGYYLLPTELCTVDEEQGTIRASVDANTVKNSPYLDSALALSSDHASGVREYYGL